MDSERPHRTGSSSGSSSSELFICFTSRLSSSSSMKISSKSILSPGRTADKFREPQISLSSSLSRRLRSNGSMKGGQCSPMFPTGTKKRGCAFENPEPSSPKVTCIGQVRVKTKKQGKKLRTRSARRGEVSFRKIEEGQESVIHQMNQQQEGLPHRNQRWVHLPLTICEALRAFGAEFNCFLPCRSSCLSTSEREKEEKANGFTGENESSSGRSCGTVFARWLLALQEGEEERRERSSHQRRQMMEDIEVKEEEKSCEEIKDEVVEEEEARVSVCVPPKNALLLMRCRSDPLRMAALANRFWESPLPKENDDEDEEDENEEQGNAEEEEGEEDRCGLDNAEHEEEVAEVCEKWVLAEVIEEHKVPEEEEAKLEDEKENAEVSSVINEVVVEEEEEEEAEVKSNNTEEAETVLGDSSTEEALVDAEILENENNELELLREEKEEEEFKDEDDGSSQVSIPSEEEKEEEEEEPKAEALAAAEAEESTEEKETLERLTEDEETVTQERSEPETHETQEKPRSSEERESHMEEVVERETHANLERESSVLPDCLLMMMCEPKLSMEVSKETWVCGTDFIRWLPERPAVKPKNGVDEQKKRESTDSNHALSTHPAQYLQHQQPPRSSCSLPAASAGVAGVSMATMIEQKLGNAVAYEPFVLTRCKSEPMRSAAKLMPEACFWKNRKLEPHRGGTVGVGAAGVGF